MTEITAPSVSAALRWTCPFCALLCDDSGVQVSASGDALELTGPGCSRAHAALAAFRAVPSGAQPRVDGQSCDLATAVAHAAGQLRASRQPLFGGFGTDVAGARALYRLACATGAITDTCLGPGLMHALRPQQDRGGFTTTLAELRTRADLIVCVGDLPLAEAPNFLRRCGFDAGDGRARHLVVLGGSPADAQALVEVAAQPGATVEQIAWHGDLHASAALLAALVARRAVRGAPPAWAALAERMLAATYTVLVGEPPRLPAPGALAVEALDRVVAALNRSTRAGALWLGGAGGIPTANQVFTWMSGLPLRSRAGPRGLEHEPEAFDGARLIEQGAVDLLLWTASFAPAPVPPDCATASIVLGHPDLAQACPGASVFIPVSTPGIGSAGHLFRTDGRVLMPLFPVYADSLPTVADVAARIGAALQQEGAA